MPIDEGNPADVVAVHGRVLPVLQLLSRRREGVSLFFDYHRRERVSARFNRGKKRRRRRPAMKAFMMMLGSMALES